MEFVTACLWNAQKQSLNDAVEHISQVYYMFRITQIQEIAFILFYSQ